MKDKVIFLDRDGTINKEINYLYKKGDFEFISNVPKSIKIFHELGYKVIVVTNQAGVAKDYYKEEDIKILHNYIDDLLKNEGTSINAYYYCPHHPEGEIKEYSYVCNCRKPQIGMIEQAIKDYDINLEESILIGDKEIDVEAGKRAGIGKCYLVRSGHDIEEDITQADNIYDNLYEIALKLKERNEKMKEKVMVVFGTRPEAIKMCPLVKELKTRDKLETVVCVTGQHREMLDQVLDTFNVVPDYDLSIMKDKQTLFDVTINILDKMRYILEEVKPDVVLVHGDTSTTFVTALACFYLQIPIGHVEAGLRTYDIYSPYPEEFNRQAVGIVAKYNFAPTERSKENLIKEGKDPKTIYVTGNTVIDALKTTVKKDYTHEHLDWASDSRLIMITAHRRENLGEPMKNMFRAIKRIIDENPDIKAIYPIHMNPIVRETANNIFGDCNRIRIVEPLEVLDFHNFMAKSYLIITDSGGIQEEAPSLAKPVLVMRDTTERPEGIEAGTLKLVGTGEEVIYNNFKLLLENKEEYEKMSQANNPYGDGFASKNIVDILESCLINNL